MTRDGVAVSPQLAGLVARHVQGEKFNVRAECAQIGCSTTQFYKYAARFAERGVAGFYPDSRRPKSSPAALTAEVEDLVVAARKELSTSGWDAGADSIAFQLHAWGDAVITEGPDQVPMCGLLPMAAARAWPSGAKVPSRATINRVLDRRGLLVVTPKRRPRSARRRFEAHAPNTRWQMDGFEVDLADGTTVCVIHIVDDCSRLDITLSAVRSENSVDVWTVFSAAAAKYGLPAQVLTDNGNAFSGQRRGWVSALSENLEALGVAHITSAIAHPQTCGKCERAHRTCRTWLERRPQFATIEALNEALELYRVLHNNHRPRRHLDGLTPQQRYRLGPLDGPTGRPVGRLLITTKKVCPTGKIKIDAVSVGIGRAYSNTSVSVIRQGTTITIISGHRLIAQITLQRGLRYQSTRPATTKVSANS